MDIRDCPSYREMSEGRKEGQMEEKRYGPPSYDEVPKQDEWRIRRRKGHKPDVQQVGVWKGKGGGKGQGKGKVGGSWPKMEMKKDWNMNWQGKRGGKPMKGGGRGQGYYAQEMEMEAWMKKVERSEEVAMEDLVCGARIYMGEEDEDWRLHLMERSGTVYSKVDERILRKGKMS